MIQAIFFDFNGVIINDERIHLAAYREVLASEEVPLTDDDYFASLGMDDMAFVRAAFGRASRALSDETLHAVIKREHERHRELIEDDPPIPAGAVNFIKQAARHYGLGIVSMAQLSEIHLVLDLAGLAGLFNVIVSADGSLKHKPAPDCYLSALALWNEQRRQDRRLPLLAEECLAVEDAPPGIKAARAAGMRTLAVTTTVAESALRAARADVVTPYLSDWNTDAVHRLFD